MIDPRYDTQIECEALSGVWQSDLCYLPSNIVPQRIEIIQSLPLSNADLYSKLQDICYLSMRVMAPVYIMVWGAGLVRRFVVARL